MNSQYELDIVNLHYKDTKNKGHVHTRMPNYYITEYSPFIANKESNEYYNSMSELQNIVYSNY